MGGRSCRRLFPVLLVWGMASVPHGQAAEAQAVLLGLRHGDAYRTLLLTGERADLVLEGITDGLVIPVGDGMCPLRLRDVIMRRPESDRGIAREETYAAAAIECSVERLGKPELPPVEDCSGKETVGVTFVGPAHVSVDVFSDHECSGRTSASAGSFVIELHNLRDHWQFDWFTQSLHVQALEVFGAHGLKAFRQAELERCSSLDPDDRELLGVSTCEELPGGDGSEGYAPWWSIRRGAGTWEVWDGLYGWGGNSWPYRVPLTLLAALAEPGAEVHLWKAVESAFPDVVDAVATADGLALVLITKDSLKAAAVLSQGDRPTFVAGAQLSQRFQDETVVMAQRASGSRVAAWRAGFRKHLGAPPRRRTRG